MRSFGHSQGEIAAAVVAGALSLADGARVVTLRSRLLAAIAGSGGMVSVGLGEHDAKELVGRWGDQVSVAAVNGPSLVTVSGAPAALDELLAVCKQDGVRARSVAVDYAGHSAQVEALHDTLIAELGSLAPHASSVAFHSTVTGTVMDTAGLDAEYWYQNLREVVRFEPVIKDLSDDGFSVFVEVSPHPVLVPAIQDIVDATGAPAGRGGVVAP